MKAVFACVMLAVSAIAEPPVDSRYLPPQQGGGFGAPSSTYGTPGGNSGSHSQTAAIFGHQSASRRPSSQYGAPSTQYGAPTAQFAAPSSQYGAPSSQYAAPSAHSAPSSQYGAPSQFAASSHGSGRGFQSPSAQYGAPEDQARQYLPPGTGGYGDDGHHEPANYNFEYMVKDEPSGNDFGHRESRQGDRAEGLYYVLLPDGRKQTVQYEADQGGYRPKISYEDVNVGGYPAAQGYGHNDGASGPY